MNRTHWYSDSLHESSDLDQLDENALYDREQVTEPEKANLVSSLLPNDKHAPLLDLDLPHKYVESSTPGHGHLYLDVELEWEDYKHLLELLGELGILEPSYVEFSIKRGQSFVRKEGVDKHAYLPNVGF